MPTGQPPPDAPFGAPPAEASRAAMAGPKPKTPSQLALAPLALTVGARRRLAVEWRALTLQPHRLMRARALKLIATPRDFRPIDAEAGRAILAGRFKLAGAVLELGPGGDPWNRPSPTRRFAVELHRFAFLPDLTVNGAPGAQAGLRLFLDWRRAFARPNAFAWGAEVLERRVFNLACAARRMAGAASDVEAAELFGALQQQADYLLRIEDDPVRAANRAAAAALVGAALSGKAATALLDRATVRLLRAVGETVLPDGGHRTRSPAAGLELLLDLLSLDDLLLQRGREAPPALVAVMDRLGAALRFNTLADGRLASFHGGPAVASERVRAATSEEPPETEPPPHAPHSGYHRLSGPNLQVFADSGAPAQGPWSVVACAQPLALEILAGEERLIANGGWSPDAAGPQAMRLTAAASTLDAGGASAGWPLTGALAKALGPRLYGGAQNVKSAYEQNERGCWLEMSHDGWVKPYGLIHERRLYVDRTVDEVRGEDVLAPIESRLAARALPFHVRFHVYPGVQASMARDGRSVLLRGASDQGWWLRNDAPQVTLEPSVCFLDGQPTRTVQVVMRGSLDAAGSARMRWKLSPVEPPPRRPKRIPAVDAAGMLA